MASHRVRWSFDWLAMGFGGPAGLGSHSLHRRVSLSLLSFLSLFPSSHSPSLSLSILFTLPFCLQSRFLSPISPRFPSHSHILTSPPPHPLISTHAKSHSAAPHLIPTRALPLRSLVRFTPKTRQTLSPLSWQRHG